MKLYVGCHRMGVVEVCMSHPLSRMTIVNSEVVSCRLLSHSRSVLKLRPVSKGQEGGRPLPFSSREKLRFTR